VGEEYKQEISVSEKEKGKSGTEQAKELGEDRRNGSRTKLGHAWIVMKRCGKLQMSVNTGGSTQGGNTLPGESVVSENHVTLNPGGTSQG